MSEVTRIKGSLVEALKAGSMSPAQAVGEFEKITPTQLQTGRIYERKSVEDRITQYRESKQTRSDIKKNRVPFISPMFIRGLWLSQGLVVVGALSGRAKSTTASNVLAGFLKSVPDKSAIVISNEEAADAIYERTACILLEYSYSAFFSGGLGAVDEAKVKKCVEEVIIPRVEIVEEGSFDMAYLEDVQAVLEAAARDRVGIVVVDYLQIITQSRNEPQLETFQISKKLGLYLKDYGKKNGVPVVCFVQLNPESMGKTMQERIQNDKTFFNHGFLNVEIQPDFETLTTKFIVHKDRFFGFTGKEVIADFRGGRYVFAGEDTI